MLSLRRLPENLVVELDNPLITHVTVIGSLIPHSNEDYMKLVRLAWSFRRAVELMIREVASGTSMEDATKRLYSILPNYVYLESAYKHAELVVEGCKLNKGDPKYIHIRKLFIVSRGNKYNHGNRNVKLIPGDRFFEVIIKYPWDSSWIRARALFGERYIPLLRELINLCEKRVEGYGARIVFRNGMVELHLSVPLNLYLEHFSMLKRQGYGLLAGLDLNSDRINMVVVDNDGGIVSLKSVRFPQVVRPGFPKSKARDTRLKSLKKLLHFARSIGADYVTLENLFKVKKRSRTPSPLGNRKISLFAKRQLLIHGIVMALKLGLTPVLVDPRGTTSNSKHEEIMRKKGLDRHMASAYIIAYRGLKIVKAMKSDQKC